MSNISTPEPEPESEAEPGVEPEDGANTASTVEMTLPPLLLAASLVLGEFVQHSRQSTHLYSINLYQYQYYLTTAKSEM